MNNENSFSSINLGRHAAECRVCAHPQREEIERDFINWKGPAAIAQQYKLRNRASVYRHAHALGLFPKRQRNVRAALEKIIERAGEVEVNAGVVVSAEHDCNLSRPSADLLPCDAGAAPLIIAFSGFPGLRVRFGRWYVVAFPTCGCDACDETAESETERLRSLIDNMTAGRFREAIRVRADGTAWKESEFWSTGGRRCPEELRLDQTQTRNVLDGEDRSSYVWGTHRSARALISSVFVGIAEAHVASFRRAPEMRRI